jgi:toxin HigB-1
MIASIRDKRLVEILAGQVPKRFPSQLVVAVERKLGFMVAAKVLGDLDIPPGNRLEALRGDRVGQHSIRVNDQWRICFTWGDDGANDVELVDYH